MATISLYRGQDILNTESGNLYIRVSLLPDETTGCLYRTESIPGSSDPVFDETISIEVAPEEAGKRVYISLWCKSALGKSHCEFIGCMSFCLSQIFEHEMGGWYYLLPHNIGRKSYVKVTNYLFGTLSYLHQEIHEVELNRSDRGLNFELTCDVPAIVRRTNERAKMLGLQEGDRILGIMNDDVSRLSGAFISRYLRACDDVDLRLEVARNLLVSYPEPYQKDHFSVRLVDGGKEYHEEDEEGSLPCNRSQLYSGSFGKSPCDGNRKSLRFKIGGALGKIGRRVGRSIRSKSSDRLDFGDGEKKGWSPYRRKSATPSSGKTTSTTPGRKGVDRENLSLYCANSSYSDAYYNKTTGHGSCFECEKCQTPSRYSVCSDVSAKPDSSRGRSYDPEGTVFERRNYDLTTDFDSNNRFTYFGKKQREINHYL